MYQNIPTKVLTGKCRLDYVHLVEPRATVEGGEKKYGVTLLIPKADFATKADIDSSIQAAAQSGLEKKWNGVRPAQLKTPIYDGDGVRPSGEAFGPECKGHWVLTASTKDKPPVVHISNLRTELSPTDIYSGMYARVTINFFPYASNGNKGVGCGLNCVCKVEEGEPLANHADAVSDFESIAPPPAYGAQPNYVAPPVNYGVPPVNAPAPQFPTVQPPYPQTAYPQTAMPQAAPVQALQIDPITGQPIIMGL